MGCLLIDWGASVGPCIRQAGPTTSEQRPPGEGSPRGAHGPQSAWNPQRGLPAGPPGGQKGRGLSGWKWLPAPPLPQAEAWAGASLAQGWVDEGAPTARCPMRRGTERGPHPATASWDPSAQAQLGAGGQGAALHGTRTCCRWPRTFVLQSKMPFPSEEYRLYRNSVV